jgi:hypothetical protein
MNTADPRHYTLPKSNLYIETEAFIETGASPLLKLLPMLDRIADPVSPDCRHCRHYYHEGRRGGHCSQLNVMVQGRWTACALSESTFRDIPHSTIQAF